MRGPERRLILGKFQSSRREWGELSPNAGGVGEKVAEKLHERRQAVLTGLCARRREVLGSLSSLNLSFNLSLCLPPCLPLSPSLFLSPLPLPLSVSSPHRVLPSPSLSSSLSFSLNLSTFFPPSSSLSSLPSPFSPPFSPSFHESSKF